MSTLESRGAARLAQEDEMAKRRAARTNDRQSLAFYRKQALKHPVQALVLIVPIMLALLMLSALPLVAVLLGEAFVIAALPRSSWFRGGIDRHLDRRTRIRAASARATLVSRLADEHRHELEQLERLAVDIRLRSGDSNELGRRREDWLGLNQLLATYVRLAIAHRASVDALRSIDVGMLTDHIVVLEAMRNSVGDLSRPWIERRLAVARRRVDTSRRAREEHERLSHSLATISEIVRWMHEECTATRADAMHAELDDALASWEESASTLQELSALCKQYDELDEDVDADDMFSPPQSSRDGATIHVEIATASSA